jgi:hypothetical protein
VIEFVGPVKCDAMVSLLEYEVLISDALAEELGIVILAPKQVYGSSKMRIRLGQARLHNTGSKHMDLGD